jgi:arylsulfatase A
MIRRLLAALLLVVAARAATPPNIVYILADDLGIGDVSSYNPKSAWQTPHLDRLAREGLRFDAAHSASSLCTPSRYAFLTGRYAWRGPLKQGVLKVTTLPSSSPVAHGRIAFLRQHGYTTAVFGKWHLGLDWVRTGPLLENVDFSKPFAAGPTTHGFDRFFGISASLDMPPYVWLAKTAPPWCPLRPSPTAPSPKLWRGGPIGADFKMEDVQPRLIEKPSIHRRARRRQRRQTVLHLFAARRSAHPGFPDARVRRQNQDNLLRRFRRPSRRRRWPLVMTLEKHGLAKNTLVIFTSDNGFAPAADVPGHAKFNHDPSAGYRGFKSDLFEGGHRVPFIAHWPGTIKAGTTSDALVAQLDLFATCADLVGAKLPAGAAEDSVQFPALAARRKTHLQIAHRDHQPLRRGPLCDPIGSVETASLARLRGLEFAHPGAERLAENPRHGSRHLAAVSTLRSQRRPVGEKQPSRRPPRNRPPPRPSTQNDHRTRRRCFPALAAACLVS